jgi:hypothetical protein
MMKLPRRAATAAVLALAALAFAAPPAPAWNAVGHWAVAKIAYDDLTEAEQQRLHKLLTKHPHYQTYLKDKRPGNVPVEEWAFIRASTWPDYVRGPLRPEKPKPDVVRYNRPGDHYVTIPVFAKGASAEFVKKVRAMPERHDVVCALKQRVAELELRTAADDDKAVALCWLLHLTGDVHQPLHCGSLFTEKVFPKGDQGGNATGLRLGPKKLPQRLHTFWDELLGVTSGGIMAEIKDTSDHAEEAYKLAVLKARALTRALPRDKVEEVKAWREFADWAAESHELARKVAYADGKIAEIAVAIKSFPEPVPNTVPEEPEGYSDRARQTADRRGAVAGYRLADLLRRTMAKE